jgi:hypothetical protein
MFFRLRTPHRTGDIMLRPTLLASVLLLISVLPFAGAQSAASSRARPTRDEMLRSMAASRARADSAAARVSLLVVAPRSLELSVGDSVFSQDLYSRLQVRGLTVQGDTLRDFARTFMLEPSPLLERKGSDILARGAGDATLWVLLGSDPAKVELQDTTRAVRIPIHIRSSGQ